MKASLTFPGNKTIDSFLKKQATADFTYTALEGSKTGDISGYDNDHNCCIIGSGEQDWEAAKEALRNWTHFPAPWTKILPEEAPLEVGETVAVLFRIFGLWWINSARIVYAFDEPDRFGFAYGTLKGHIETGEECFWIERDSVGTISYHIRAFSKPYYWFVKLAYPIARYYQRQFVKQSMAHMQGVCNHTNSQKP